MKRIVLLALVLSFLLPLNGCGGSDLNDPDVKAVRESHYNRFGTVTFGNLFDQFYASPKWKKEISSKGEVLVVFEGKIPSELRKRYLEVIRKVIDDGYNPSQDAFRNTLKSWFIDVENYPEYQQLILANEESFTKIDSLRNQIDEEAESSIKKLENEYLPKYRSIQNTPNDSESLKKEISALKMKFYDTKRFGPDSRSLEIRRSINDSIPDDVDRLERVKIVNKKFQEMRNAHEVELEQIKAELDQVLDRKVAIDKKYEQDLSEVKMEWAKKIDLVEMEASEKKKRMIAQLDTERRTNIIKLVEQLVNKHAPAKGDSVKIVWLKVADMSDSRRSNYVIYKMIVNGKENLNPLPPL